MPDGGSDCCGMCIFNMAWGAYHDPARSDERPRYAECQLRGIRTTDPFWTYCDWFNGGWTFRSDVRDLFDGRTSTFTLDRDAVAAILAKVLARIQDARESFTPVWTIGVARTGGYERIPWDGPNQPFPIHDEIEHCSVCGRSAASAVGIVPARDSEQLLFCSNDCYWDWWKTRHPAPGHSEAARGWR